MTDGITIRRVGVESCALVHPTIRGAEPTLSSSQRQDATLADI